MSSEDGTDRTPQGSVHEHDCAVCGKSVRYVDYCPRIFLCSECGFPDPAPCVDSDEDGHAYIVDDCDVDQSLHTDNERSTEGSGDE